ncbi:hypothetical protein Pelo_18535 [Pelomyxa schiedti]|nr:hypothetical protein Pelo_18535 [Pelomyxa schiedti]
MMRGFRGAICPILHAPHTYPHRLKYLTHKTNGRAWSEYDSGGIDEFVIKMTVVVAVGCILLSAGIAGAIALWINRNRFRRIMSTNKPGEGIALMSPPEHP